MHFTTNTKIFMAIKKDFKNNIEDKMSYFLTMEVYFLEIRNGILIILIEYLHQLFLYKNLRATICNPLKPATAYLIEIIFTSIKS